MFTQTALYALRAAACLASAEPEAFVSSEFLAANASIPITYVPKVMRRLVSSKLVEAKRGRNGGFRLARRPETILFHEILDASESFEALHSCAFGHGECDPANPCPLHNTWSRLNAAVDSWAALHTLADVGPIGDWPTSS